MTDLEQVQYLIKCLQAEMPEYAGYALPDDFSRAFDLYRALCNLRLPKGKTGHTLPDRFYIIQAQLLSKVTAKKGITDARKLPASRLDPRLSLWQGDITTLRADAIVNAANSQMLGCFVPLHSCVDNLIQTMAGVEMREQLYRLMRAQGREEAPGKAKITPGYRLPASFVIHTVGPRVAGSLTPKDEQVLADCYESVLQLADDQQLSSVAFCCISTGVFGFPPAAAAKIAVKTIKSWLDAHKGSSVLKVVFNVFKDSDRDLYQELLNG
ncbi:hypothetical protein lacNasYZ03_00820 [Lactobacillus nasalidis]|uniref:Macro domain-containing protein n=1 Tax=Lactobacillus nasalidis TaxID=2797258 RepID=A0ABQ3W2B8_9LACO|nr:protein-ADP-ribose hydrolase [Lactobacillus nasalidis]GHV98550.1 hypothetical protein lacNasYZ01_17320 [Lactobacillus nasalidis]GHV98709.1 hypothetical protein lacNasYZ02_01390 [Lactobacillus nasalidis]GHW00395.1 hypothetical protein lacNasYZ03_00820 [Lactobacillus nasalidis]